MSEEWSMQIWMIQPVLDLSEMTHIEVSCSTQCLFGHIFFSCKVVVLSYTVLPQGVGQKD